MNTTRLANVIFDMGTKITQTHYQTICEEINNDTFTFDEHVLEYKNRESFLSKIPFKLNDGTSVLVSESTINKLSTNISEESKQNVCEYMKENYKNFYNVIKLLK